MKTLKVIGILITLLFSIEAWGQSAAAELHFESAEKAYNAGDYQEALRKLDDTEKLTGSTSRTLYLRIVAQDKILNNWLLSDYNENQSLVNSLRENAQIYLEEMESFGLDDRYREIFALSEKYKDYTAPDHSADYALIEEEKRKYPFMNRYEFRDEARFKSLYPDGVLKELDCDLFPYDILYDERDQAIWRWGYHIDGETTWYEYTKAGAKINKESHETWVKILEICRNPKKITKKERDFLENLDHSFLVPIGKNDEGEVYDNFRIVKVDASQDIEETNYYPNRVYIKQQIHLPDGKLIEINAFFNLFLMEITENGKTVAIFKSNEDGSLSPSEQERWDSIVAKYKN